jgi:hypothetical protein
VTYSDGEMLMTSWLRVRRAQRVPCAIVLLAWLALAASSCGDDVTPTNPSGVPNAAGVWVGTYRIKTCTDVVSGAPVGTVCTPLLAATAPTQPVRLSVQQTNDQLIGNIQFSGWYSRSLILNGSITRDGEIVLNGTAPFVDPACPAVTNVVSVNPFTSTLNRALDGMTGNFKFVGSARVGTTCVFAEVTIDADTVTLTKQ